MANYMSSGSHDESPVYCLYAVVVHEGDMNVAFSGHYVCYVKNTLGNWYKIDDSTVHFIQVHFFVLSSLVFINYGLFFV